jgi:hypothetical protein
MDTVLSALYAFVLAALAAMAVLVLRRKPGALLHRLFTLTCLALIVWLGSLYALFHGSTANLTFLGRINFASIAAAVALSFLFVAELASVELGSWIRWAILAEGTVVALVSVMTPLVDRLESVHDGAHVTDVGPLFFVFVIHTLGFPLAAAAVAYMIRDNGSVRVRSQLSLVGFGVAVTAAVNALTGIVLPYGYGVFSYEEVGALCVAAFAGAVGYAILTTRLFDIRLVVRKAVLYSILFALLEKAYSSLVEGAARAVPGESPAAAHFFSVAAVAFIAISFHPLRELLEPLLDQLLFGRRRRRPRLYKRS